MKSIFLIAVNFFKKKPKTRKTIKTCYHPVKKLEVGVTVVEVKFTNGKSVETRFYGTAIQNWCAFKNEVEKIRITESIVHARRYLMTLPTFAASVVDDQLNPTEATNGTIESAYILKTNSHEIDFVEFYVEEVEETI